MLRFSCIIRLLLAILSLLILASEAFQPSLLACRQCQQRHASSIVLQQSSFFGKFEDFDKNNDDDDSDDEDSDDDSDDDEYIDIDVSSFRNKMGTLFDDTTDNSDVDELINYARSQDPNQKPANEWAEPVAIQSDNTIIDTGTVLIANPAHFCPDIPDLYKSSPPLRNTALLNKFGLTIPPPVDLGPDRRADLLPVLIVVDNSLLKPAFRLGGSSKAIRAVLLNRRTGYLLGDLEQGTPVLAKFCIQPLWLGGVDPASAGLDMLHQCANVAGAQQLTDDGLFWGGDTTQAQEAMDIPIDDKVLTGFDFKFFVQSTVWSESDLVKEIAAGTWFCAKVSKEVLFKSRDRMGTQRAKPLWTEIMELLGGDYRKIRDLLYQEEYDEEE